ncbi:DUF6402 family protein [Pseudomonas mandelii]|uniref:Uncharacterized protein n=1 Tax=Pseudomonas mandelii TaxID=75612 RepID=A0A502IKT0_9PSED|nr:MULTISPECIES: DUF6402 family protein [Pseudomonas]TPG87467.1 hypothetical protein EAH74_02580 [Pseudomonas mandelii]TPG97566.1 hypothetical protein EAH72_07215 [Pseudomonas caspiana]
MSAPAPITAQLTPSSDKKPVEATVEDFQVTDIPGVMTKMGWKESARIMQRWLDGAPFVMSSSEKLGRLAVDKIAQEKLFDDLNFDWLTTASPHTGQVIKELIGKVTNPSQYNELIGRQKGLTQLAPGLLQFMTCMRSLGVLDEANQDLVKGTYDYSALSARALESVTQYNFRPIGTSTSEKKNNPLDDVYGTLGGFVVKFAVTKFSTTPKTKKMAATLHIEEIGCYIRDTYEFLNEGGDDQLLGYWNHDGVVKPSVYAYFTAPKTYEVDGKVYFKVTNDSYNQYRQKYGKGGDLFVYSTVKKVPVSIHHRFTADDFSEFSQRSVKPKVAP